MNTVQTVLGPIPVEKLGRTLVHEHLFIAFEGSREILSKVTPEAAAPLRESELRSAITAVPS